MEILSFIAKENDRFESLITSANREIELIRKYQARLIFDVVTGKIDVRGIESADNVSVEK